MRQELKADLALLSVTLVWGISFPLISSALKCVGPYTFLALRYLTAAIILFPMVFKRLKNIEKKTIKGGVFIGLSLFVGSILQTVGLVYTTPSKSGFLTGINVVLVPIFIAIIYKNIPDLKSIIGVVLSIIGLAVMSLDGSMSMNLGDVLTIFSAVAFAIQILLVDKYAKNVDIVLMSCLQMFVIGILALIPSIIVESAALHINELTIGSILFTAVFCTIYAFIIQNKMQPYTNPTHAAVIFLAEPVFSAVFSTFIGDKLTGKTLKGCIFILIGMIIINLKFEGKLIEVEE